MKLLLGGDEKAGWQHLSRSQAPNGNKTHCHNYLGRRLASRMSISYTYLFKRFIISSKLTSGQQTPTFRIDVFD